MKVAVYGSLMNGLYNHDNYLKDSTYIGQFETEPKFTLVDLGAYPGLLEEGNTSITMEVYEIDDIILQNLDRLESYDSDEPDKSYYKRKMIKTPYGESFYYVFNGDGPRKDERIVETGNWKEYRFIEKLKKK